MDKGSKANLGLKKRHHFTNSERHQIIQEMISLGCTKRDIWEKYTGKQEEHGQILRWMREFGYNVELPARRHTFTENKWPMKKKERNLALPEDSFDILKLKKRISELESQLQDAEMRAVAFSTMIDIAEKQFNLPIRKKASTKPLKK